MDGWVMTLLIRILAPKVLSEGMRTARARTSAGRQFANSSTFCAHDEVNATVRWLLDQLWCLTRVA